MTNRTRVRLLKVKDLRENANEPGYCLAHTDRGVDPGAFLNERDGTVWHLDGVLHTRPAPGAPPNPNRFAFRCDEPGLLREDDILRRAESA